MNTQPGYNLSAAIDTEAIFFYNEKPDEKPASIPLFFEGTNCSWVNADKYSTRIDVQGSDEDVAYAALHRMASIITSKLGVPVRIDHMHGGWPGLAIAQMERPHTREAWFPVRDLMTALTEGEGKDENKVQKNYASALAATDYQMRYLYAYKALLAAFESADGKSIKMNDFRDYIQRNAAQARAEVIKDSNSNLPKHLKKLRDSIGHVEKLAHHNDTPAAVAGNLRETLQMNMASQFLLDIIKPLL